jgi:hypothetical protein
MLKLAWMDLLGGSMALITLVIITGLRFLHTISSAILTKTRLSKCYVWSINAFL